MARHGQTEWNVEGRWQGSTDIPLDDVGKKQANMLAERLGKYPIQAIYSSPLSRAAKTAEAIAIKLGLEVKYHDGIIEICLGDWEGLSFIDIRKKYPNELAKWECDKHAQVGMGVENNFDVQHRAKAALLEICETEKRDTLIVSHGGWINRLMCWLLHIPLEKRNNFMIGNTGLCVLECIFADDNPNFQVVTLNDFSHLEQAGFPFTVF